MYKMYKIKDDDSNKIIKGKTPEEIVYALSSQWEKGDLIVGLAQRAKLAWGIELAIENTEVFIQSAVEKGVLIPVNN